MINALLGSTAVWQNQESHTNDENVVQGKKRRSIEVTVGCEEEATSSEGTDENLEVRAGGESESESYFLFHPNIHVACPSVSVVSSFLNHH